MFVLTAIAAKRLEPTFVSQAHSYANTMVTDVIEKAVNDVLSNGNYSETAHIIDNGSATSVEADTVKINKLKSELTVKIQNDIAYTARLQTTYNERASVSIPGAVHAYLI